MLNPFARLSAALRFSMPALLACMAIATHPAAHADPSIQNIYGRSHVSLDGRWSYIIDPYEMGYYDYRRMPFDQSESGKGGFYDDRKPKDKTEWVEYEFDRAPTMSVPGDWNSQAEKLQFYEGTVWLRQVFQADPKPGKHYALYFGAVNYEAHVYLNGKKLGMHKGGFTPFQFDVTDKLAKGRNVVVVKADNTRHQDEIPTVNTDWWNYGGITRDVLLAELPATYIADYKVQLAKGDAHRIEGFIQMAGEAKAICALGSPLPSLQPARRARSEAHSSARVGKDIIGQLPRRGDTPWPIRASRSQAGSAP